MSPKVFAVLAIATALGGCVVAPAPGYYGPGYYATPAPAPAPTYAYTPPYPYYTNQNCPYYYDTWQGPVCVRSHPSYGYVYSGGPGVVVGAPVAASIRFNISRGYGGWRRW